MPTEGSKLFIKPSICLGNDLSWTTG